MGVLTLADGPALAAYCQCWERWVQAREIISQSGRMIREQKPVPPKDRMLRSGLLVRHRFVITVNPAVAIEKDALDQMRRFQMEFGMTPASRTRIHAQPKPAPKDSFEEFLKGGHRN